MLAPTPPSPLRDPNVRIDEGAVNERILARETRVDYRRVEAASVKMPARFTSAEGKRLFVRMFATLQLNAHFVSVIARTRLEAAEIVRVETVLRERLDALTRQLDDAIDRAELLFQQHGITRAATYDARPLDLEVGVMSANGRRYLEAIMKLDQLMPLLQTLEIHEVLTAEQVDLQRRAMKRQVRGLAVAARHLAGGLRRRMNEMAPKEAGPTDAPRAEASRAEASRAEASHAEASHAEASHAEASHAEASHDAPHAQAAAPAEVMPAPPATAPVAPALE
jgi:hypothetical protein